MTYNPNHGEFIFFVPNNSNGTLIRQQIAQEISIPAYYSTPFTYYAIDWIDAHRVVGPCVDETLGFGLCESDYSSGETTQRIRLAPSFNSRLTATYFDRDRSLYTFVAQHSQQSIIQIYVTNVNSFEIMYSV